MQKVLLLLLEGLLTMSFVPQRYNSPLDGLQKESIYDARVSYQKNDGTRFKFSDHKGKVILVYLWAYWCAQSEDKPKRLAELNSQYDADKFLIIAVSMEDNDMGEWTKYIRDHQWTKCTHIMIKKDLADPLAQILYQPEVEDGETSYLINSSSFYVIGKDGFGRIIEGKTDNATLKKEIDREL